MMPPHNEAVKDISKEFKISEPTLYNWRNKARIGGHSMPGNGKNSDRWSSEDKFLVVVETYTMNQSELAECCRKKGLYKEQIEAWRSICLGANSDEIKQLSQELREEKKRWQKLQPYYY